ncbi:uncharacterized protein LOC122384102 isoform X2 [Amphibalanus amphitrite]|uniref:uncharacterized protein LOC122384102 isoform X2 n=1 Tax=Amphibalanus amphitrite TaxID=1232801 RepID=UPI001C902AB3|nr:uncharacterized protein LOC122384102 isoform X2 [Amphibalanus amphitrite]
MGPTCKAVCLVILGLYIPFQLVETFYFDLGENNQDEQNSQEFFGPFFEIHGPVPTDKGNEREDEANSSHESDLADFFPSVNKKTSGLSLLQEQGLGCDEVREERFRCCRVYDQVIEAWWCPERRPFCCHQGTYCAVCCTPDELRRTEAGPPSASCQEGRPRSADDRRQPPRPEIAVDGTWFWSGMKAAWLTMFAVLLASLLCTCLAYRCIKFLVTFVNEEDSDLEEEYLAYHFDSLGLVNAEDRQAGRPVISRALLPPKYSDINFIPVQPDSAPVVAAVPGEPPPQYTSEPETETAAVTETETETETRAETARPTSAPPPAGQL